MAAGGGSNGGALPPWRRRAPRTPETVRESRDMARGGQKKKVYLGKKNCVNIYIYTQVASNPLWDQFRTQKWFLKWNLPGGS